MNWVIISVLAYFFVAVEVIGDKFLLSSKRVSHPSVYAFYSGVLGFSAAIFAPFDFHRLPPLQVLQAFFFGIVFIYGILCLFYAIEKSQASQVIPVVGAVTPLATFVLAVIFLGDNFLPKAVLGIMLLIIGGFLVSYNFSRKIDEKRFFAGFFWTIAAGVLLAVAFTGFKDLYDGDSFINIFVWTRIGALLGAISLLVLPVWRKSILGSLTGFRSPKKDNLQNGAFFVGNKTVGGIGSIMLQYAIALGSVTLVNALVAIEHAFVFVLGAIFSIYYPKVFREEVDAATVFHKLTGIVCIAIGIFLVSMK